MIQCQNLFLDLQVEIIELGQSYPEDGVFVKVVDSLSDFGYNNIHLMFIRLDIDFLSIGGGVR